MWKSKALVKGLIVCFGVALPVAAWGMDNCCGGHSGGHGAQHGTGTTHEQGAEASHEHGAETSHEHSATNDVFENYFDIRASLAQDSLKDVSANANALAKAIEDSGKSAPAGTNESQEKAQRSLETDMAATARSLAKKTEIESMRTEFGKLSSQLYEYRKMTGMPADTYAFACDMAKNMWLQDSPDPGNPYYGRSMAKCARKIE
ncbi:MAG: DUF3347 domain-containing protein [Candidatus Lindowbacteria bacterium]|nr:DUF3347 domain-containing protein [Candidatus Lindowbacteria bacterium]